MISQHEDKSQDFGILVHSIWTWAWPTRQFKLGNTAARRVHHWLHPNVPSQPSSAAVYVLGGETYITVCMVSGVYVMYADLYSCLWSQARPPPIIHCKPKCCVQISNNGLDGFALGPVAGIVSCDQHVRGREGELSCFQSCGKESPGYECAWIW